MRHGLAALVMLTALAAAAPASAHHILGRPAYGYNGDASSPPSISLEVQIGKYNATMMAFPLELKPRQPVRVKLYATRLDTAQRFDGAVTFTVRDDGWLPAAEETLGVQTLNGDGVYAQGMEFSRDGDYVITAKFESDGEPYIIDFPVVVGKPLPVVPLAAAAGLVAAVLGAISWAKRRRRQVGRPARA
jgi:hypothetical protein